MIAKNIKGKSFKGCVQYVMNESCELLEAKGVWAETTKDMIHSFAMQRSGRQEIKQPVGHIPISFSPEDKHRMTNDFMLQLAKEYMQEMDIKNTQYIIVRHHNADNEHLHIVYNRIDNNLKLISVNNDYKRNVRTCKKLKDKHNLTYGKNKDRVKREKLNDPDKVKYYIYDAIKAVLSDCRTPADLQFALRKYEIELEYKHSRTTNEIEGVSFWYSNISFKGSQIDRRFSYGNLKKAFEKNLLELKEQRQFEEKTKESTKQGFTILGVETTAEQEKAFKNGEYIYLKNMAWTDGNKFSSYVFLNDDKNRAFFSKEHPNTFVKYGKYEMRLRDKILIEGGQMTKAKVKWYGGIDFQYPYLWKANKSDTEYQESWGDPRVKKGEKPETEQQQIPKNQSKKRGRGM